MRYASVCDGIGAAHVAWQPLGWQCSWTSEIEPFPAAVVEQRFGFVNVGDMTKITEEMLNGYGPVELLVGGTPCQSFSVAGLRGGLADPRGNLALRFVQLAAVMQPKWIVWENVPGVLSSGKGRDFGTFLGALGELGYGFAYRVLDAQWFGVAQRRRRVFVVGHLGDWRRAAAVLFERESVFGNPPTRGAAWQGVARSTAASLTSSGRGVERSGESRGQDDVVLAAPQVANPLTARMAKGINTTCDEGQTPIVAFHPTQDPISSVDGLTHCLGSGSSRGCATAAVAFTKSKRAQSTTDDETWVPGEVSPTMSCFDQGDTRATTVVAFDILGTPATNAAKTTDVHVPLRARQPGQSEASTTTVVAQGFTYSGYSNQPAWMTGDRTDCLPASGHSDGSHQGVGVMSVRTAHTSANGHGVAHDVTHTLDRVQVQASAFSHSAAANSHGVAYVEEGTPPLRGGGAGNSMPAVAFNAYQRTEGQATWPLGASDGRKVEVGVRQAMAVRRLTPRECERLQGFPDDYTLVQYRKKPAADGPRYRALGNSMAVPVMRWIGERIAMVESKVTQ
jgi:DNA (cytosine-5)-methyltransferase 1